MKHKYIDQTKLFFTADWHLWHGNLIKKKFRDFTNEDHMNKTIGDGINAVVPADGILFMLGDVCWVHDFRKFQSFIGALTCKHVVLLFGNHDKDFRGRYHRSSFFEAHEMLEIEVKEGPKTSQHITLCHYAMRTWNHSHRGSWQLHGHSHGSLQEDSRLLQMDVGVDCNDFKPVSYAQVKRHMEGKRFQAIDHHGATEE